MPRCCWFSRVDNPPLADIMYKSGDSQAVLTTPMNIGVALHSRLN